MRSAGGQEPVADFRAFVSSTRPAFLRMAYALCMDQASVQQSTIGTGTDPHVG